MFTNSCFNHPLRPVNTEDTADSFHVFDNEEHFMKTPNLSQNLQSTRDIISSISHLNAERHHPFSPGFTHHIPKSSFYTYNKAYMDLKLNFINS